MRATEKEGEIIGSMCKRSMIPFGTKTSPSNRDVGQSILQIYHNFFNNNYSNLQILLLVPFIPVLVTNRTLSPRSARIAFYTLLPSTHTLFILVREWEFQRLQEPCLLQRTSERSSSQNILFPSTHAVFILEREWEFRRLPGTLLVAEDIRSELFC